MITGLSCGQSDFMIFWYKNNRPDYNKRGSQSLLFPLKTSVQNLLFPLATGIGVNSYPLTEIIEYIVSILKLELQSIVCTVNSNYKYIVSNGNRKMPLVMLFHKSWRE